jgi:DNA-binding transcriptional MerR regulator
MGSSTGETPYSIREVVKLTGLSVQAVTRLFEHERGVLIYEGTRSMNRRRYRTIKIPRHIYRRVMQRIAAQ